MRNKRDKYDDLLALFLNNQFLNKIKLFKLEAEGAEPEILLGCEPILHNIEYISADVGFERGIKQKSTLPEVNNFLMKNGFELVKNGRSRIVCLYKNKNDFLIWNFFKISDIVGRNN